MFQFNSNDLDFGIYRIYNLKRKEIENFIDGIDENCLEPIINKTLEFISKIEKQVEQKALYNFLKDSNKESLLNDPLRNFEKIQQLIINFCDNEQEQENLKATLTASTKEFNITDEIKDKIYNHILGYFEMYYSNGDFGYNNRSRNLYKVPYEADYDGNDTMFHWKHKGSLYIKTGASFNAIKFKINHIGKEVELRLETNETSTDEEVARNNNKDSKQKHYKFNRFEEVEGVTRIVFNLSDKSTTKADLYKSLFKEVFKSDEDIEKYLFSEGKAVFNDLTDDYDKVQDGSIKGIGSLRVNRKTLLPKINKNFERGTKVDITNDRFTDETLETIYNIDQKLNSFYIGNDSDYFIHENLQDFLTQEKERYIKNHILSDLQTILDGKLDNTTLIIAKAFESVSSRIIEFLSTIEEFQKKLFTMKKKVVESEYCLTIDNIDEKYYPEILDNKSQILEWEKLFSLKVKTLADLKAQPTLVLDTKFFKQVDGTNPFKDKFLGEIVNLDEKTNGLLIYSDSYQALDILGLKYKFGVSGIYIDPPYNTGKDGFIYKDSFRSSSWCSFIGQSINKAYSLLNKQGSFYASCDENEHLNFGQILNNQFSKKNHIETITWNKRIPKNDKGIGNIHEYIYLYSKDWEERKKSNLNYLMLKDDLDVIYEFVEKCKRNGDSIKDTQIKLKQLYRKQGYDRGITLYCELDKDYNIWGKINMSWPNANSQGERYDVINPVTKKLCPVPDRGWRWTETTFNNAIKGTEFLLPDGSMMKGRVWYANNERTQPSSITYLKEVESFLLRSILSFKSDGSIELENMGLGGIIEYPKPTRLLDRIIYSMNIDDGIILDYFAGSGTTGHSVINQNLIERKNRKYILIDGGKHFETLLIKRIKKSIFSNQWQNNEPKGVGSLKHIVNYLVLEQYEDVLDAIEQTYEVAPINLPLKYLYKPELNKINSTLDISKPFSNKIKYGQPTKEGFIDLVDTYNYLQGYEVKTLKTYSIGSKYYKVVETIDNRIVVWRDIVLGEDDSKNVMEIAEKYPKIDSVEVNADFNILATLKDKQLQIGNQVMEVRIIHVDVFNQ